MLWIFQAIESKVVVAKSDVLQLSGVEAPDGVIPEQFFASFGSSRVHVVSAIAADACVWAVTDCHVVLVASRASPVIIDAVVAHAWVGNLIKDRVVFAAGGALLLAIVAAIVAHACVWDVVEGHVTFVAGGALLIVYTWSSHFFCSAWYLSSVVCGMAVFGRA